MQDCKKEKEKEKEEEEEEEICKRPLILDQL